MKIVVLTPFYRPGVGGSGQLVDDVAQHLHQSGHKVVVLTYSFDAQAEALFDPLQPFVIERVTAKDWKGAGSVQTLVAMFRLCVRFRPDVVFCGAAFPTAVIALVARSLFVPFVVYTHGEDVSFPPSQKLSRRLGSWALSRAAGIAANSSFSAQQARTLVPDGTHVEVVHPWIDSELFGLKTESEVEDLRDSLGLRGRHVLLTVARLEERKGHDRVIEALPRIAEEIPDISYLIIGKGSPSRLMNIAERLRVDERVRVLEYVNDVDLPAYYQLCDIYVMVPRRDPSNWRLEGFGMVFVEAAAAGRPTIAGNRGGCADAVADGETGLIVDGEDPSALAEAVIGLLVDPERASQMGVRGQLRARCMFAPDRQLERLSNLIVSAAKRR